MNNSKQNTHPLASEKLIGSLVSIGENTAEVKLKITSEMAVDEFNLAHGGFVFGLADYAAMLAINEPTVVLGKAEVKFLKPAVVNDELIAKATIPNKTEGKKIPVSVNVFKNNKELIFEGEFICFVLDKHVLKK